MNPTVKTPPCSGRRKRKASEALRKPESRKMAGGRASRLEATFAQKTLAAVFPFRLFAASEMHDLRQTKAFLLLIAGMGWLLLILQRCSANP